MTDLLYSNCCYSEAGEYEDAGICPECKEHCEWVDENGDEYEQEQRDTARTLGEGE